MEKRNAVWTLTFTGILVMLSLIVLGKGLVLECSRLNSDYAMQKVLVSVKNQIDHQGINSFSADDIKRLRKELSTQDISYIAQSGLINTSVSNGNMVLPVRLIGVDYRYPLFSSLTLEEGSFITQEQEEEGAMVAVIDDDLAWELFKTENATGKTIDIFGGVFRIIGVVEKDDTLIGKLTDDGLSSVYIPAAVMLERDDTARITALQIKTADTGTLDQNRTTVSTALRRIGKDPSQYNIIDYNLIFALMEQKPLLFVFILGVASMLTLLAYAKNAMKKLYSVIRDGCKKDYFSNVIKYNLAEIGIYILEMTFVLTGIVLIWLGIRFRPYIPPQNIPDELINISYYSDLIKGVIQDGIQNMGYVPPRPELIADTVNTMLNLLFCISVVLGFLLLYTGFREVRALNMDSNRLMLIFSLFFFLSLGILAVAGFLTGLPFMLDVKSILVAWVFIFLNILHITKRKESGIKNV
ncbi:MAG: ABC transporter permease [Bacillota bacterium]